MACSYDLIGSTIPDHPVILSVPHAGRDYPAALSGIARAAIDALAILEDRFVDAVAIAARDTETMLVQRRARAWIDLNRSEQDRDPMIESGWPTTSAPPVASVRARGGLGLIPRRTGRGGDLWRRRLTPEEVEARIVADHRPYHAALAATLAAARDRFGVAILLDVHSMPPLAASGPRIVLGDRHGHSAGEAFVAALERAAAAAGVPHARNAPYAGGHVSERHGCPGAGIHAVQVEFDRRLYLDARLDRPGDGLAATAAMLRAMIDAVAKVACIAPDRLAAE